MGPAMLANADEPRPSWRSRAVAHQLGTYPPGWQSWQVASHPAPHPPRHDKPGGNLIPNLAPKTAKDDVPDVFFTWILKGVQFQV